MSRPPHPVTEAYRDAVLFVELHGSDGAVSLVTGSAEFQRRMARLAEELDTAVSHAKATGYAGWWGTLDAMEPFFLPARDTTLVPYGFGPLRDRARLEFRLLGSHAGMTSDDVTTVLGDPGAEWSSVRRWLVGRILDTTESTVAGRPAGLRPGLRSYTSRTKGRRPVEIVPLPGDEVPAHYRHVDDGVPAKRLPRPRRQGHVPPAP